MVFGGEEKLGLQSIGISEKLPKEFPGRKGDPTPVLAEEGRECEDFFSHSKLTSTFVFFKRLPKLCSRPS